MKPFYNILANTVIASIANMTVWFAIIFYAYLQTKSVLVTSILSGLFLIGTASTGIWFGSIVDHNKKKFVILLSSSISLLMYIFGFMMYQYTDKAEFTNPSSVKLWILIIMLMTGVVVGNLRNITLPTLVAILVPEPNRDKANGLSGTATGISFLITSVISGLLVGHSGMFFVLILAISLTVCAIAHILTIPIPEKDIVHLEGSENAKSKIDIKGTLAVLQTIPGLIPLILFTTFNNFLGGVFMSLMDAYGLSLVSVQVWGFLWGFLSTAFIIGGIIIAKFGLGKNPLRSLFMANTVIWTISCFFTLKSSIILLSIGMFLYLCIVPFIEASEQTIIQKVVPQERLGRVFGFAQSIEQSASPLTAFLIGPITQLFFIPFMTTGKGVQLIGSWFGTGSERGIALVFTITGIIGLVCTLIAMNTKHYTKLSKAYLESN